MQLCRLFHLHHFDLGLRMDFVNALTKPLRDSMFDTVLALCLVVQQRSPSLFSSHSIWQQQAVSELNRKV